MSERAPRLLSGRVLALVLVLAVAGAAAILLIPGDDGAPPAPRDPEAEKEKAEFRPRGCPVTLGNGDIAPGQANNPGAEESEYLGNGSLWVLLQPRGIVRQPLKPDGTIAEKFPWWRGVRGRLRISGHRLGKPRPALRSYILPGYGLTGFQSTAAIFPRPGCWKVTGRAGKASLSFVTLVVRVRGQ